MIKTLCSLHKISITNYYYLFQLSAEMLNQVQHDGCVMNRVQHDDVVRETSPVVEAPEVTLVYQLTFIFEYRPVHCL